MRQLAPSRSQMAARRLRLLSRSLELFFRGLGFFSVQGSKRLNSDNFRGDFLLCRQVRTLCYGAQDTRTRDHETAGPQPQPDGGQTPAVAQPFIGLFVRVWVFFSVQGSKRLDSWLQDNQG